MKVQWEEKDIVAGRRYSREGLRETWQIGYLSGDLSEARYVSISMVDGMVTLPLTKAQMAENLTEHGYLPVELLPNASN